MSSKDQVRLESIRESYLGGSLEFIVGAGASMASGLPSWNKLNYNLLRLFFRDELSALDPEHEELQALSVVFAERFGRESVVDVVRQHRQDSGAFCELLQSALYGGQSEFELASIQFELAAAVGTQGPPGPRGLYTFNYDDLIERAIRDLRGVRATPVTRGIPPHQPHVVHLHGYLPPGANAEGSCGTIILSEKDYLRGVNSWADRKLEDLFDSHRDVLLVGLSLADPRLRRLLFKRLQRTQGARAHNEPQGRIFVLLSQSNTPRGAELATRRAHKTVSQYEIPYWEAWDVHVRLVEHHDLVPFYLRQIRLGEDPRVWVELGRAHLQKNAQFYGELYEPEVQLQATHFLRARHHFVRSRFAIGADDEIHLGFFVPGWDNNDYIQLGFKFGEGYQLFKSTADWSGDAAIQTLTEADAEARRLDVRRLHAPQGAAGHAFLTGTVVDARSGSARLDQNFSAEMRVAWSGSRTFQSLLCVPVFGSERWVPLGVAFVSSNRRVPFWAGLEGDESLNLQGLMRSMFSALLGLRQG